MMRRPAWILAGAAALLLLPTPAYADNCSGLSDCYGYIAVAVIVLVALAVAVALLWEFAIPALAAGAEEAAAVSLEQSIARGLVQAGSKLADILGAMERLWAANPATNMAQAVRLVEAAAASVGLMPGTVVAGAATAGSVVIQNKGGVLTEILANGEIIVTRGADVLLHLIP